MSDRRTSSPLPATFLHTWRMLIAEWTRAGVKRRVQKRRLRRMFNRTGGRYSKRCRNSHRFWWHVATLAQRGEVYWPLKDMRQRT